VSIFSLYYEKILSELSPYYGAKPFQNYLDIMGKRVRTFSILWEKLIRMISILGWKTYLPIMREKNTYQKYLRVMKNISEISTCYEKHIRIIYVLWKTYQKYLRVMENKLEISTCYEKHIRNIYVLWKTYQKYLRVMKNRSELSLF